MHRLVRSLLGASILIATGCSLASAQAPQDQLPAPEDTATIAAGHRVEFTPEYRAADGAFNLFFAEAFFANLSGDDCIESHGNPDLVIAGPGDDTVYAGDHHDIVLGGRGNDEIHGGAGRSYTVTAGPVVLEFDLGNLLIGTAWWLQFWGW